MGSGRMLRLFGPAHVTGSIGALPLLAYLLVALIDLAPGRRTKREEAAALLWEDANPSRAHANLRQLLTRITAWQTANNESVLQTEGRALLRSAADLPSDLSLLLAINTPTSQGELRLLDEVYTGDFLIDVTPNGPNAADWIEQRRATYRDRFIALGLLGARDLGGPLALRVLSRISEMSPYDDAIVRQIMIAKRRMGPGPIRHEYQRFEERLRVDLKATPEQATTDLLGELTPASLQLRPSATTAGTSPGVPVVFAHVPKVLILPPVELRAIPDKIAQLVDVMIDEVTFSLARERTFAVFAPHTARQLVRNPFPGGNPYGAGYVVNTTVRSDREALLSIALTNVATHEVLLSETLRIASTDLIDRQSQIAGAIAAKLASGVERAERRHARATGSASAYVHYLLGSDATKVLDLPSLRRAKKHLRHAVKLSPEFVPARAMLARTMCLEWLLLDRNDLGPVEAALGLAREAVTIDPTHPLGHREVGHAMLYLDKLDEGVEALRSATGMGPHHADILMNYADGLVHLGDMKGARVIMDKALGLNPLAPDQYYWTSGTIDYMLRNYSDASASFKRMKESTAAARFIAAVEAMNGDLEEAHRQRDIFMRNHPDFRLNEYMVPQRRLEDRAHYLEGLRLAGFA